MFLGSSEVSHAGFGFAGSSKEPLGGPLPLDANVVAPKVASEDCQPLEQKRSYSSRQQPVCPCWLRQPVTRHYVGSGCAPLAMTFDLGTLGICRLPGPLHVYSVAELQVVPAPVERRAAGVEPLLSHVPQLDVVPEGDAAPFLVLAVVS